MHCFFYVVDLYYVLFYNYFILKKLGCNMKIKENFVLRKVSDAYVVMPIGSAAVNFNCMINLNETGAFLFNILVSETSKAELLNKLICEYDVSKDVAQADVNDFINKLKDANLLE